MKFILISKSNQFFYKNGLNVCFLEGQDLIEMDFKRRY